MSKKMYLFTLVSLFAAFNGAYASEDKGSINPNIIIQDDLDSILDPEGESQEAVHPLISTIIQLATPIPPQTSISELPAIDTQRIVFQGLDESQGLPEESLLEPRIALLSAPQFSRDEMLAYYSILILLTFEGQKAIHRFLF